MNAFSALQYALPKRAISRVAGWAARAEHPLIAKPLIRAFAAHYRVDMTEAAEPSLAAYRSFNAFFTRALRDGARPMPDASDAIASPADGYLSQFGPITGGRVLQAKGRAFSVTDLLTDATLAASYEGGCFFTVYLSPRDYHRVHAPAAATLRRTIEVPGRLFSVNDRTADAVPGLFARNERLVCVFDEFTLVLVGALIVASIETVWEEPSAGEREGLAPRKRSSAGEREGGPRKGLAPRMKEPRSPYRPLRMRAAAGRFERGAELGRFLLGSTAIVLFPPDAATLRDDLEPGRPVRMGETLGTLLRPGPPERA